jgi:hypothetical protein
MAYVDLVIEDIALKEKSSEKEEFVGDKYKVE